MKKKELSEESKSVINICQEEAEALYRSGTHNCAEAVLESIRRRYAQNIPEAVVASVAGFGGGSYNGCICGAVSGGTVAIGLVLNDKKLTAQMTKDLHGWFKEKYSATCCSLIRRDNPKGVCAVLTGEVAGKIAEMMENR